MNEFIDHHAFLTGLFLFIVLFIIAMGFILALKQGVSLFEGIMNGFTPKFLRKTTGYKKTTKKEDKTNEDH